MTMVKIGWMRAAPDVQIAFSLCSVLRSLWCCVCDTQLEAVAVGKLEIATWFTFYWKSLSVIGSQWSRMMASSSWIPSLSSARGNVSEARARWETFPVQKWCSPQLIPRVEGRHQYHWINIPQMMCCTQLLENSLNWCSVSHTLSIIIIGRWKIPAINVKHMLIIVPTVALFPLSNLSFSLRLIAEIIAHNS